MGLGKIPSSSSVEDGIGKMSEPLRGLGRGTERSEVRFVIYASRLEQIPSSFHYICFGTWRNSEFSPYKEAVGEVQNEVRSSELSPYIETVGEKENDLYFLLVESFLIQDRFYEELKEPTPGSLQRADPHPVPLFRGTISLNQK